MFKRHYALFDIEKSNKFVDRIIFLSLPSALVFIMLAALHLMSPLLAIASYAVIIVFNTILLFPITFELQQLKRYISSLAQGESVDDQNIKLSEKETKEIVEAVNAMHRFWAQKADNLEAQSISDTAVLDTLPDPIMMIDRSGNILGANLSSRTLFGDRITDLNVENLFDSNNFIDAVSKVLKKESEAENLIFYVKEPVNQKLYAHIKQLPWQSKGRAVAVISLYDLTKAMKIEKMQSDFVANASHELRTPLAIISGFIETLLTTAKGDEAAQEHFLKIMQDQAAYMSSLIENLLSLSKIELTQDQRPDEKTDIAKIIEDVQQALSLRAAEREITLRTTIEPDLAPITADSHQIKQVIQNLTDNAIKYGLSKSVITIKAHLVDNIPGSKSVNVAEGKAVAIAINNKGPKISPENMARLTERFYRMQEHKDLNIRGTGLGLSIAKQIIIRHHGNITVTSTSYNGTTFTVYLPCEQN
ncbi:MAG: ATP-binding protein [Pseudomonadota bacterium]|nr:ATP-binding protein [Pseudomonadota bacterium]